MKSTIYLVENDELVGIEEEEYDSEDLLQENLAKHPRLLAGDQINPEDPRKWLLVEREISVPDEEGGAGRWSADHLFLDQDGIPTFVEVKRSRDTRTRREVVGQMLDYASNASLYWGKGRIRSRFESRCESEDMDFDIALEEKFGEDVETESFWSKVDSNLKSENIRLLFVADDIPSELKRVVEFLNGQMNSVEVLALEVKQYAGENQKALVPRIIGQTEEARERKGTSSERKQWDEQSFFQDLEEKVDEGVISEDEADAIRDLHSFGREKSDDYSYGTGRTRATLLPVWEAVHPTRRTFTLKTNGDIRFSTNLLLPLDEVKWSENEIEALKEGLNEMENFEISMEEIKENGFTIDTRLLTSSDGREKFKEAVLDFVRACEEV